MNIQFHRIHIPNYFIFYHSKILRNSLNINKTVLFWGFFSSFLRQAHYSTGRVCASFTSTAMTPITVHEAGKWTSHSKDCITPSWQTHSLSLSAVSPRSHFFPDKLSNHAFTSAAPWCRSWTKPPIGAARFSCVVFPCQRLSCSTGDIQCYATVLYCFSTLQRREGQCLI